jgi:hypothetical protein
VRSVHKTESTPFADKKLTVQSVNHPQPSFTGVVTPLILIRTVFVISEFLPVNTLKSFLIPHGKLTETSQWPSHHPVKR